MATARIRILAPLTAMAAALILGIWSAHDTPPALAVPHAVSPVPHPYDPDWPEVSMLLAQKCVACHRPDCDRADLSSYEALMAACDESGQRAVVPGRPEASLLVDYVVWNARAELDSDLMDSPMMPPEHAEWLTAGQQETIRRWIARGALQYQLPDTCSTRPLLEMHYPSARECRICHPKQFTEWSRSMHAYAQHSPVMEAFNLTLIERTSGTIGTFCTRCHTPLGTALGENGSRRNVHRSRLSMEGVTCVVCHRIKEPYYKANARHAIVPGDTLQGCMYGPFDDAVSEQTGAHASQGQPYIRTSQFCGSCHDVTIPSGVRLEEAFSEWQNSPAAARGITCQQCHMGPVQGVPIAECNRPLGRAAVVPGVPAERIPLRPLSDHTFSGPDYSLLPDTEFPEKLDWMYEVDYRDVERLTPYQRKSLGDLRRRNRRQLEIASAMRYELLKNAARIEVEAPQTAAAGDTLKVRVAVLSTLAGHSFPTGFTAERQAWVQVVLRDDRGCVLFASGDLDPNGDLRDEHSYAVEAGKMAYDKQLLNLQSKFVALTNRGTERSVVVSVNRDLAPLSIIRPTPLVAAAFGRPNSFRVSKSSLPPLAAAKRTYHVPLPECPGDCLLEVRLNFRHLPPALFDKIGIPHLKHLLEVVVIDEHVQPVFVAPANGGRVSVLPWTAER